MEQSPGDVAFAEFSRQRQRRWLEPLLDAKLQQFLDVDDICSVFPGATHNAENIYMSLAAAVKVRAAAPPLF